MPGRQLVPFARVCGWTLARAHARSGDRAAIAGYLGRGDHFERALARFAEAYADRTERDHAAFAAAARSGRIAAEPAS
jgi:NAD(P)H-dependent flavin oxidoreductase YrpB (nitropropane dioxygenase family)